MNNSEYLEKLNNILKNIPKFLKINKDPTEQIRKKANGLINAKNNKMGIRTLIGDYKPGFIYGTIKIHKENNPYVE